MKRCIRYWVVVGLSLCATSFGLAQSTPPASSAASGVAQRRPPLTVEVLEWGLMYANPKDPRAIAVDRKEVIPARLGVTFGMIWSMSGYTGSRLVTYDFVLRHPPMADADGKIKTETRQTIYTNPINGSDQRQIGYRFEAERERVPGEWTLAIWYDGKEVLSRRFTVVLPEVSSNAPDVSSRSVNPEGLDADAAKGPLSTQSLPPVQEPPK